MRLDLGTARTTIPRELDDFVTRFAVLTDAELTRPTPCPEFDVLALGRHVAGASRMLADGIERWVAGDEERPPPPKDEPPDFDAVVAQLIEQRARVEKLLADVTDERLDGKIPYGFGVFPAAFGLALAVFEAGLHHWDLRTALGEEHALPADVVTGTAAFLERFMRRPIATQPAQPFAYRLRATTFTIEVASGGERWDAGVGDDLPVCEIAGTDTDVLLFCFGRITHEDARLAVSGATTEAASFKTYFPGP